LTFADYLDLSQTSLSNFSDNFLPVFTNIVAAIIALAVGVVVGAILKWVINEVSRVVNFERALSSLPFYDKVVKGGQSIDATNYVGEAVRWTAIIVFLIPAVASLQIEGAEAVFSVVFAYVTNVVIAALYLIFAFVVGWFVQRALLAMGSIVGTVPANLIANVAYAAFVVFAALQSAQVLGVTSNFIQLFIVAVFAAGALAFGLAGKEVAADWVRRVSSRLK
jgi:hypothetical protein